MGGAGRRRREIQRHAAPCARGRSGWADSVRGRWENVRLMSKRGVGLAYRNAVLGLLFWRWRSHNAVR
jgi:hypothetical protein